MIHKRKFSETLIITLLKIGIIWWLYIFLSRVAMLLSHVHAIKYYGISILIVISFSTLIIVWYIKKEGNRSTFALADIRWQIGLWSLLLCISEYMLMTVFYGYPEWISKDRITSEFVISAFVPVFLAPIVEEIVFRGLLQKQLLKKLTPWLAILITSTLFSLVHFEYIPRMLPAFLSGIFCGFIYYKTDKLILCILYHSFGNLLTFTSTPGKHILLLQIITVVIAGGLMVYSVFGFTKDTTLNKNITS